jgi:hypothetical protein
MTSFKKIYEMIELHNNIELKNTIDNHNKFDPFDSKCNKSYFYAAVFCNNFEAFKILVNHPKFDIKSNKNVEWIQLILKKYMYNSIENCRYLDELIKLNILFYPSVLAFCTNIYIVEKIIHNIDNSKPHDLITCIFNNDQSTDIQNYILEFVFNNYPGVISKDFVDSNILHYCISKGKIGIIETLINSNVNVKTCLGIPIILVFLNNSKLNLVDLDYYVSKEYLYEENLLDKKWYTHKIYQFNKIEFLINNFETFKKCFRHAKDDLYEFTNLIINSIISHQNIYYLTKNYLDTINIITHFLINLNKDKNHNFFEKIVGVHIFESIIEPSLACLKAGYNYYPITSVDKEICKVILGCILFHKYEPTERFSKVIQKTFKPEELTIGLDKFRPIIIETKITKKGKTKKLNL